MATQASDSIRPRSRTTSTDELAVIAQRAQAFTNSSGAAIAINEGNTNEIVCRARSGSSAPDVGTSLRVEGSFTGICIQSGKELRCDDAETDTRVDTTAIRALGIRSMVVTPIKDEGKVVGVLAVFAPTAHAFTITHVAVLKTMADQISALLQKERRTKDEPLPAVNPVPTPVANPVPMPAIPVPITAPKPVKPAVPLPPPVVIKPALAPSPSLPAAAAVAPARSNVPSVANVPNIAKPEPHVEAHAVSLAADISVPASFPRKEEKREYKPEPLPRVSFGTLDAVAGEQAKSSSAKFIIGGLIAVAIVAGAAWFFVRTHKSASTPVVPTASQPQNSEPTPTVAAGAAENATNSSSPVPVSAPAVAPIEPVSAAPAHTKPSAPGKTESKRDEPKKKEQPNTPQNAPTPATVAVGEGPSKITRAPGVDQSPEVSPTLAVGGSASAGLASLASSVDTSTPTVVSVSKSDLINAKPIHTVPADYPGLAKSRRLSGVVVIKVIVGTDGKVRNAVFVSGPTIFRDAAFESVKQWVFKPAQLNGQPIEQETEIRMKFNPTN